MMSTYLAICGSCSYGLLHVVYHPYDKPDSNCQSTRDHQPAKPRESRQPIRNSGHDNAQAKQNQAARSHPGRLPPCRYVGGLVGFVQGAQLPTVPLNHLAQLRIALPSVLPGFVSLCENQCVELDHLLMQEPDWSSRGASGFHTEPVALTLAAPKTAAPPAVFG